MGRAISGPIIPDENAVRACLRTVEIELRRGCKERAIAAVERAFAEAVSASRKTTDDSPVLSLGLIQRTANALESSGIFTLGDLKANAWRLERIPNFGRKSVEECMNAVKAAEESEGSEGGDNDNCP